MQALSNMALCKVTGGTNGWVVNNAGQTVGFEFDGYSRLITNREFEHINNSSYGGSGGAGAGSLFELYLYLFMR